MVNNMQEIDNIFQEIGKVNNLFFNKLINEERYKKLLKPIYGRLKKAISDARQNNKSID